MLSTTLNEIRKHCPCDPGWKKLLKNLGKTKADDEPLLLETILKSNGLDDALWALCAVEGHRGAMRMYACYCAKRVLPIFEKVFPEDNRPRQAIEAAEQFAKGNTTTDCTAASATRDAASAARDAAWDAACAACAASAARDAAWDAARAAARDAARAAARDASAARDAAWADFEREFVRLCRLEGEYGEL